LRIIKDIENLGEQFDEACRTISDISIRSVTKLKDDAYKISVTFYAKWQILRLTGTICQITLVAYLAEELLKAAIEERVPHLFELLHLHATKAVAGCVALVIAFFIARKLDERINKGILDRYKSLLRSLLLDKSRRLWIVTNALIKITTDLRKSLVELEIARDEEQKTRDSLEQREFSGGGLPDLGPD
jgi:hypothetical protein